MNILSFASGELRKSNEANGLEKNPNKLHAKKVKTHKGNTIARGVHDMTNQRN
jgi:hypothetical protein